MTATFTYISKFLSIYSAWTCTEKCVKSLTTNAVTQNKTDLRNIRCCGRMMGLLGKRVLLSLTLAKLEWVTWAFINLNKFNVILDVQHSSRVSSNVGNMYSNVPYVVFAVIKRVIFYDENIWQFHISDTGWMHYV